MSDLDREEIVRLLKKGMIWVDGKEFDRGVLYECVPADPELAKLTEEYGYKHELRHPFSFQSEYVVKEK